MIWFSLWWYIAIVRKPPCQLNNFWVAFILAVLRWWFCCCWFLFIVAPIVGSVFVPCFVVHCFMSFLVLQLFLRGCGSWLLYFVCRPGVWWLLLFCGSSSRCSGSVCSARLWYFLIILTCLCCKVSKFSKIRFVELNSYWLELVLGSRPF